MTIDQPSNHRRRSGRTSRQRIEGSKRRRRRAQPQPPPPLPVGSVLLILAGLLVVLMLFALLMNDLQGWRSALPW